MGLLINHIYLPILIKSVQNATIVFLVIGLVKNTNNCKMKLNYLVNWMIYNYPTLFRSRTYTASRLKVLNHLFLVIGNGFKWHDDGYMTKENIQSRKTLPKDFFNKNLYILKANSKDEFKKSFKNFHYFKKDKECVFAAQNYEEAKEVLSKYSNNIYLENASSNNQMVPYPLSKYSALSEIMSGITADGMVFFPQEDWLNGCRDVALEAIDYFNDKSRYSTNLFYMYHIKKQTKSLWIKYRQTELDQFNRFLQL